MYNKSRIRDKLIDRFQNSVHHENDIRGYENSDIIYESIYKQQDSGKSKSISMFIDTTLSDSSIRLSNVEGVSTFIVSISKEDYINDYL